MIGSCDVSRLRALAGLCQIAPAFDAFASPAGDCHFHTVSHRPRPVSSGGLCPLGGDVVLRDIGLFAELGGRRRRTIHEQDRRGRPQGHNFPAPPPDGALALASVQRPGALGWFRSLRSHDSGGRAPACCRLTRSTRGASPRFPAAGPRSRPTWRVSARLRHPANPPRRIEIEWYPVRGRTGSPPTDGPACRPGLLPRAAGLACGRAGAGAGPGRPVLGERAPSPVAPEQRTLAADRSHPRRRSWPHRSTVGPPTCWDGSDAGTMPRSPRIPTPGQAAEPYSSASQVGYRGSEARSFRGSRRERPARARDQLGCPGEE